MTNSLLKQRVGLTGLSIGRRLARYRSLHMSRAAMLSPYFAGQVEQEGPGHNLVYSPIVGENLCLISTALY